MKFTLRMTQVNSIHDLTPHMRRITLEGDDLHNFPTGKESAHVKLLFPQPGQEKPKTSFHFGMKKWMRSYTVRHFDAHKRLLSIDFAINDHKGLAADWAMNAKKGDYLAVGGSGDIKHTNIDAPWHLIAGDLTALPAIAATVEKLPADAKGYAYIQVPTEHDRQTINTPKNIHLKWVINNDCSNNKLLNEIKQTRWLSDEPAILIAGESKQVREIRHYIKQQPGYKKTNTYISGYWRA